MNKKIVAMIMAVILSISIVGCGKSTQGQEDSAPQAYEDSQMGIKFSYSKAWVDNYDDILGMVNGNYQIKNKSEYSVDIYSSIEWGYKDLETQLAGIYLIKKEQWEKMKENNYKIEDFLTKENTIFLGEQVQVETHEANGFVYVIAVPDKSKFPEDTEDEKMGKSLVFDSAKEMLEKIEFTEINK
ncbi:hypothetical protein [Crassaminicella profunda]|uniref:hypothetical protein n=1 Tax=Crassaminicella profunda TaxID=1286698 RepID=UPI001CA6DC95|nr:hypothetical protein [Crassaminicella profunda]QZY54109.1 hypothetical protein K7H06_13765 [Crassaminicella profunda]